MFERSVETPLEGETKRWERVTLRDVASIMFRQRIWVACTFAAVMGLFFFTGFLTPSYEAQTAVLVRRDRSDPMISSQENAPSNLGRGDVTEEELNSEAELIKSPDLLRSVVLTLKLQEKEHAGYFVVGDREQTQIAKGVKHLAAALTVKPLQKTDLVSIRYESREPLVAQHVLETLSQAYLQKHMQVHRPRGEFELFEDKTEQYRKHLSEAEGQLTLFTERTGVSAPKVERDLALKNLADARAADSVVLASIAESQNRIDELRNLKVKVPSRHTTAVKTADNAQLLEQKKSKLLDLELKHDELIAKFQSAYKPVQELEKQIADIKVSISSEDESPLHEKTTDIDPAYEWVEAELIKATVDLGGLKAKKIAILAAIHQFESSARELQQSDIDQGGLIREAKIQEDSYLLYIRKREEARTNDALDRGKILNVAIAEPALLPVFPTRPLLESVLLAVLLATTLSTTVGYVIDMMDGSFRTPQDVSKYMGVPVLAFIPKCGSAGVGI